MVKYWVVAGRVVACAVVLMMASYCGAGELEKKVDELFAEFDSPKVPGAVVGVIHDGKIVFSKCYGLAKLDGEVPTAIDSNFRLASVSKQFTAMCIMVQKERGLLSYEDPITRFFPEFPEIGKQITVRQLLWHTSGLVDYEDIMPEGQTSQLKDKDVLALAMTQHGTYFTPGSRYRYSNTGYSLLALIVEKTSGKTFATFLKENIFGPLGMANSVAYEKGISTVPNRAYGYRKTDKGFVDADQSLTSAVLGDGGIYCSLADYLKWDLALYGEKLVSRRSIEEAFTPGTLTDGKRTIYGFGWRIEQKHGVRLIHHNGDTCGFATAVRRVPEKRLTVVVLTNRDVTLAHPLADELIGWMLKQDRLPLN